MPKLRNTKRKVDKFHPINCPIFGCKTIIKHSINLKRHIIIVYASVLKHLLNDKFFISNQLLSFVKKDPAVFDKINIDNKTKIIGDFIAHTVIFESNFKNPIEQIEKYVNNTTLQKFISVKKNSENKLNNFDNNN